MPILEQFQPQLILVSSGFDACMGHPHPLGGYELTPTCNTNETKVVLRFRISRFFLSGFGYMTNQLMKLADGKVVLVLEGGYELNALAECGKACVKALLGREVGFAVRFGDKSSFCTINSRYHHLVQKLWKPNPTHMR